MAFTVEDGTGVADANAYITLAFFKDYHDDRGVDYSGSTDSEIETAIIKATDYMELRFGDRWIGYLSSDATTLTWPRGGVYDRKGVLVEDTIPTDIKKACAEYALRALTTTLLPDPTTDASGKVVSRELKKIGPIETEKEFQVGRSDTIKPYPAADKLLNFWIAGSGGVTR